MANDVEKLQRHPKFAARWQNAQQQLLSGKAAAALAAYRDLVQRFPGVAQLWFELGIAAMSDLQFALTEQAFARAEELAPRDADLLVLLGQQYHRLRRLDSAARCFENAVAANPSSAHARLSLASWHERANRLAEAAAVIEACLAQHPGDAQVRCVQALVLQRQGRNGEAEAILRELLKADRVSPNVAVSARHQLAVVLDGLGNYPEAMRWLNASKDCARQSANVSRMQQDYDLADRQRRELLATLTTETLRRWQQEPPPEKVPPHLAFLGGHPRSGTTLLEQILGAHPNLLAFDESEAFAQEIWHALAPLQAAHGLALAALDTLSPARRLELRSRYFKSLLREAADTNPNRLWLDKNPSPTAALPLWLRLFPQLKVVIALRDPRDVLISCYFQNLMLTPTNANFLSLERTAKHYSDLMDVWLRVRELGGFDWVETKYEDLVRNVEIESRRVTEFLGLTWHPDQAQHHVAAQRKTAFSPTYADAAKAVHTRAVGRWQRYAEALAPIQERLAPYCRALGYN